MEGRVLYVSFITELELLGYQELGAGEIQTIERFLQNCIIVEINASIKQLTIELKRSYKLKLPDAIIAGTSQYINIPLISVDRGFEKIAELQFINYEM